MQPITQFGGETMLTRYAIRTLPGETQPCAVADVNGCFYSTGEVDRLMMPRAELDALLAKVSRLEHQEIEEWEDVGNE
jgi:hypothetical protein